MKVPNNGKAPAASKPGPTLFTIPIPEGKEKELPVPPPDTDAFRLTKEIRGELVARTGHDMSETDPAYTLVVLNEIVLRELAKTLATTISIANKDAASMLERIRLKTIDVTSQALIEMSNAKVEEVKAKFRNSEAQAKDILNDLQGIIRLNRWTYWVFAGSAVALFALGVLIGASIHG